MKLILILLALVSLNALAVDPTLVRQSFGKCYYDDGSVVRSHSCPSRLRLNAGSRENPYKLNIITEDSRKFYRDFMEKRNQGLQQGMSAVQSTIEKRRIELAKEKANQKGAASSQPNQIPVQLITCRLSSNGAEFAALACPEGSFRVR